jgi:hypothetical protein
MGTSIIIRIKYQEKAKKIVLTIKRKTKISLKKNPISPILTTQ